jgi:agmatine/peptidylarginine deiminase
MTTPNPPAPPPEMLAEIQRLMRETRKLIEGSSIPFDGAMTVVCETAWILSAKRHGMTRAQMQTSFDNLWGEADKMPPLKQ